MITLLTFAPAFDQPAASPFCVKAIWLLNQSGQPWTREDLTDPRTMPHGKLPAIRANGRIIADSDAIRAYLETLGTDFDSGLGPRDRAHSRAIIRMAEEHMYFHIVMDRWIDDRVWPIIRETYFAAIPRPLRGMITGRLRKSVLRGMQQQGLGRLDPEERLARIEPDLCALADLLSDTPFLFGQIPTAADISVAAMLGGMRATPYPTLLQRRVAQDNTLADYVDRCRAILDTTETPQRSAA